MNELIPPEDFERAISEVEYMLNPDLGSKFGRLLALIAFDEVEGNGVSPAEVILLIDLFGIPKAQEALDMWKPKAA